MQDLSRRIVLRNLGLPSRLVIAVFLICIGIGYFAALVQLHFQHATPGKLLPDADDVRSVYHGRNNLSQLERLLLAGEGKPFNGSGAMGQAFTTRSAGWKSAISRRAREKKLSLRQAETNLRSERDGERLVLLEWIRTGASKQAFEENSFTVTGHLANHPITETFADTSPDGSRRVKIGSIFETRCVRCHHESAGGQAAQIHLETWEHIHAYCEVPTTAGGISTRKLTQSTHVHLLGFAMLYGLTGLIMTLTSYPGWLRGLLGVLPLLAQVVDIGFWWLARLDPIFARAIMVTGAIVACSLFLQIGLSLFNLFGRLGKTLLVVMLIAACAGGYVVKEQVIDPYIAQETLSATSATGGD